MAGYADMLFGEADDATIEPVQAPIERPSPIQRPGELPRRVSPLPTPAQRALPPPGAPLDAYLDNPAAAQQLYSEFQKKFGLEPRPDVDLTDIPTLRYMHRQVNGLVGPPDPVQPSAPPDEAKIAPVAPPADGRPSTRRYSDDMFGPGDAGPAPKAATRTPANALLRGEPDAPTWLGRRVQDVMGKQDPRYADMPTIAEALKNEGKMGFGTAARESWGWLTGADDNEMARVYKGILGQRFVRTTEDVNGYPVIVYKGQDGREAMAYVNKPGLDVQDAVRGVVGIAPNVGAGIAVRGVMKGAALLPRVIGQAMGQGAASVAQDAAGLATGARTPSGEDVASKAMWSAAGGAGGEVLGAATSALWRKLVVEPRYFNRATGQLTAKGEEAAAAAGLDPATLPRDVAQSFGRSMADIGDEALAARTTMANEFRIPRTQGEMEGNVQKLLREQQMTGGGYGDRAAEAMKRFRDRQTQAIDDAVRGDITPQTPGMAGQLAPDRAGARLGPAQLGSNIRANSQAAYDTAKEFENKAWKAIPDDFRAPPEVLAELDNVLPKALADRGVRVLEEGLTPAAKKMDDMIVRFQAGEMPTNSSKFISRDLAGHVDIMRRRLLAGMEDAATPTDKKAAAALYDGFNDWIVEAAKMTGDPSVATKMVTARAISRKIHEVFDGKQGTAGANILSDVLKKTDSAEGIVNALFSTPGKSEIKNGAIDALTSLKKSYDTFLPPEAAKSAWDDIRLAYWMKTVEGKTGDATGAKGLSSAIKTALNRQESVARMLYTPEEIGRMQRMAKLLEDVGRKNPNSSWSGVSIGAFMKDIGNAALTMIGANSIVGRTALGTVGKGVQNAYGAAQVRAVTGGGQGAMAPQLPPPPWAGPAGGLGGMEGRERR